MNSYDAIVVGLGAMGSAVTCRLALAGHRVLGLEQFGAGHELGSSHGDSRIIREQYFEHPLYVPLVQRAYELWRELENRTGRTLLTVTGGLMLGPHDGTVVRGTLRSAAAHHLKHELLTAAEVHRRFPAFEPADGVVGVLDPRAGFLDADGCNAAHIEVARRAGADVRFLERVVRWRADGDGATVETTAATYRAARLVLACGGWLNGMLDGRRLPLTVERQVLFWFSPDEEAVSYHHSVFPIYAYEYKRGYICYGFPRLPRGVKAAVMHSGATAGSPDDVSRGVSEGEDAPLRAALRPVLPGLANARVTASRVCLFTNTPDEDFFVDWHPDHRQVLIVSPCSGHGFKFASAIGEAVAGMAISGGDDERLAAFRVRPNVSW